MPATPHRQFPHLIIPIKRFEPNTAFGTKTEFDIERDIWTETLFDMPDVQNAIFCTLDFQLFVNGESDPPFKLWGAEPYVFNVTELSSVPNKDTDSWNHRPAAMAGGYVANIQVWRNGTSKVTGGQWMACGKSKTTVQYLLHPADPYRDGGITWFELDQPLHGLTYTVYTL
ncbi:hypothetical protein K458DRAFT_289863 [Lentithecium fluviatile CBS 122367]|uniref:Ubiquitin 3 binding protein But2 C-terminal domain-containing protein n=1 Tax=Lentithecium fluviatile CBS 122367 TaxID=1168545 RepID=A0A6G1JJZ3_9PLEO|nr:hypothetical protein K458DRAFT_289863 [Lentithecium fluviatile CBS 122367]